MLEKLTEALTSEGFISSEWGYDLYEENSFFSKHINILKTPIDNKFLVELMVAWGNAYTENGIPPRGWGLGNCYLSKIGITWLHPDFPDNSSEFIFSEDDLEFVSTQGVHFIKKWFNLHTHLDFLIGLSEYQGKFNSNIPGEIYDFLGYASNKNTRRYDDLIFLYAMKGDYKKSLNYLKKYGVSDRQGYAWTQKLANDLENGEYKIIKPYEFKSDYTRGGGIFLEANPEPYRVDLLKNASLRYISPNTSKHRG